MYPYKAFRRSRYSTFTPFSTHKGFLCSGFTSHMMSKNSPPIFNRMDLSYGMSALRYAPGKSKISTSLPLFASMMRLVNKASRKIVSEDTSYFVMWHLWGRLSAQFLLFSFPLRFSFIKCMALSDTFFCDIVRLSGFSAPITFMSYSFLYSLYMATTALSPCFLVPFLVVILVNVIPTASLCMSYILKKIFFPVLVVN